MSSALATWAHRHARIRGDILALYVNRAVTRGRRVLGSPAAREDK